MKNIIKTLNNAKTNNVYSPAAIYYALLLLAQTTAGETKNEILKAIGVKEDELILKSKELYQELNRNAIGNGRVALNSSLWINNRLNVNEDKCNDIAIDNNSAIRKIEMGTNAADKQIQKWINVNTNNFLKDSVSNIKTLGSTLMELITAIYLKGSWGEYFPKHWTKEKDFNLLTKEKVKCDFMNNTIEDYVYFGEHFTAVKLRIVNLGYMCFVLPNEGYTPSDISNDKDLLNILNGNLQNLEKKEYRIHLSVPKFDINAKSNLTESLTKLGIVKVFDMNEADFSTISNDKLLCVTDVNQAARIKIDEEGIEAAAYVEMAVGFGGFPMPKQLEDYHFDLDRPFMFSVIKDRIPMFTGIIVNPIEK